VACTERHALSAATINARVEGDCVALAATGAWTAEAAATDARSLVLAFEAANDAVLREAIPWATATMTGRPAV